MITSGKTSAGPLGKIKIFKKKLGDETRDDDAAFGRLMAINRGPPSVKRALVIYARTCTLAVYTLKLRDGRKHFGATT